MLRTDQPEPVLSDLDRRVRASVEDELRLLSRRVPRLPDQVASELRRSLDRIAGRLVLDPARDYAASHPYQHRVIGFLFACSEPAGTEGKHDG